MELIQILNQLAQTPSRNDKVSLLKANANNSDLERLFVYAYHPEYNFYISDVTPDTVGTKALCEDSYNILDDARNRVVTGNALKGIIQTHVNSLDEASQTLFRYILTKDCRCGVTATTLKSIWPNNSAFKEFKVMLCQDYEKYPNAVKYPVYAQLKYDASRIIIKVNNGNVTYHSRNGKVYNINNPLLDREFLTLANGVNLVFDGEIAQRDKTTKKLASRTVSNGVATKFIRNTASHEESSNVAIIVWDVLSLDDFENDTCQDGYSHRLANLKNMFLYDTPYIHVSIAETKILNSEQEVTNYAQDAILSGEEGIIIKNADGLYRRKRSKDCLKIKDVLECDLEIVDVIEGTGKYADMCGSLKCTDKNGHVVVHVGTGMTDAQRLSLWEDRNSIVGKVCAIKYNMKIYDTANDNYSLFLPRFVEVREDKTEVDDLS